jgi:peroxiredoxin Q/BCP
MGQSQGATRQVGGALLYPRTTRRAAPRRPAEFRDEIFAFRRANAVILGVSVDKLDSKEAFAEGAQPALPGAFGCRHQTTKAYGSLTSYPQFKLFNIARRDTFIIDPEGRIAKRFDNVNPNGHSKMVLAELAALQKR